MIFGYTFSEILVVFIIMPIAFMLIIAAMDFDIINNRITKSSISKNTASFVPNAIAWKAGFKVFYHLIILVIPIFFILNSIDGIKEEEWFLNILRYIFIAVNGIVMLFILGVSYENLLKK